MKEQRKKYFIDKTVLFTLLYMVSYITRINYGAVISEIVRAENMQKSTAALALTASAVTYGIGQLVSGYLGDRLNPKKLILAGLLVTVAMNLIIPFCRSEYQMTAAWGINGIAQAFMWPPLVRIMTSVFNDNEYKTACLVVSCAASLGTMLVYAISPLCILIGGWRCIFFVSAVCAMAMAAAWRRKCPEVRATGAEKQTSGGTMPVDVRIMLGAVMVVIALQGVLRDSVSTWMPSYIAEVFHMDNKIAILTGVVLPIISILTTQLAGLIYRKFLKTELLLASVMFAGGFASSILLYAVSDGAVGLSVGLAALLSGCMYGANWVLTSVLPLHFARYGKISFVTGLLNCSAYVGSAVSVYGIAVFSEHCGWANTLLLWGELALAGGVICAVGGLMWKRVFKAS